MCSGRMEQVEVLTDQTAESQLQEKGLAPALLSHALAPSPGTGHLFAPVLVPWSLHCVGSIPWHGKS